MNQRIVLTKERLHADRHYLVPRLRLGTHCFAGSACRLVNGSSASTAWTRGGASEALRSQAGAWERGDSCSLARAWLQAFPSWRSARAVKRRAFTLIEVMLACVLAAMLSVVMLQVMRTTLLESRRIAQSREVASETWLLREQLARDLSNARGYQVGANSLNLAGFMSRDPITGLNTQQMALVSYQIVPRGSRSVLQRTETSYGLKPQSFTEVVWDGAGSIVAFPKREFLEAQANEFPDLDRLGVTRLSGGMIFRLFDPTGKILLEIL
ncbi:MAG: prepilin-type N-terminal cleavage/methylation domain-containing protein [Pirellulaceae bacterium]|nr:prepilin-type N-terminal cleavage/methylation domain-containing protein [Pirellulaceae bacterium]